MDPEISAEITRQLTTNGVRVLTSHEVLSVEKGVVKAENRATGDIVEITSQAILIAIGREAVVNPAMYTNLHHEIALSKV